MTIILGLIIAAVSLIGGFAALGGKVAVLWQPWELVIIIGVALGTFFVANPMKAIVDTLRSTREAVFNAVPKKRDYLDVLALLYALMRELRAKGRNEVEPHIENPQESEIFRSFPTVYRNSGLLTFVCDYFRLILVGNARAHEIEALMDEELQTIHRDQLKPYYALSALAEALPAIGIVAAVLGVIKAMGAIDQSPQILGSLIGAALVGTFVGIFLSYALVAPVAHKVKGVREHRLRPYIIVKQSLLAFMNGAPPQIALEHGRKTISAYDRPTIDEVENETMNSGGGLGETVQDIPQKGAA
ncbi:flagellar motor stator protein MotA [Polymorphum gilvum]|uniref:Chemotaxis transmembrane protein n=1 Tax=Polymorphum gilvum (strain LMG 25793 / CGMCC 1.9160 / SL003B-26A1) TaxID=991905 RepID=F2J4M1_POLGS|nr:flagellar motor stator protein MotA [Polymorphum gilvum]ADZ72273.1 Chemotaxis transmembrane protein [Polymorphum gilvum SL003B-26A1]